MGTKSVVYYLLWFILLTNIKNSLGRSRFKNLWFCPPAYHVHNCLCGVSRNDDLRQVDCFFKGNITEYVSKLKNMESYTTAKLDVSFTKLEEPNDIPSKLFGGLDVKVLEFHMCNIRKWSDEPSGPAFVGLEDNLERLIIEGSLHRTESSYSIENEKFEFSLSHLRKLTHIEMFGNTLDRLYPGLFSGGLEDSLEEVSLRRNRISMIADGTFANLKHLNYVDLSENEIKTVSRSMFPDPALSLNALYLNANKIEKLPTDIFTNMPALSTVEVGHNEFSNLPENTWNPVWSQLEHFQIDSITCDLKTIKWMSKMNGPTYIRGDCEERPLSLILEELEEEKKEEDQDTA